MKTSFIIWLCIYVLSILYKSNPKWGARKSKGSHLQEAYDPFSFSHIIYPQDTVAVFFVLFLFIYFILFFAVLNFCVKIKTA